MEDATTARFHSIRCPFCGVCVLEGCGDNSARCASCRRTLDAELFSTLREIQALSEVLGAHPCECGNPEMRRLPDGIFHCLACGSEVMPAYGSAESGGSPGATEAYLSGWIDGFFGSAVSFVHNRELARWEGAADRLDYYRGHRAGREARLGSEEPRGADAA